MNYFFALLFLCGEVLSAQVSDGTIDDPGDIAFVGYHDNDDGFSFVFLDDCPDTATIRFIDEEWNGTSFGTGEGDVLWTNNTGGVIAKGTVINITDADDNGTGISASTGTASEVDSGFTTSASLATEQIYAVTGTRSVPGVFLTFIGSTSNASLNNTGLTLGDNAVQITGEGYYSGDTTCNSTITDCASMLNDPNNWTVGEHNYPSSVISALNLGSVLSVNFNELNNAYFKSPVSETLEVSSNALIDDIKVYSMSGVLVASSKTNNVDVTNLMSGIYITKIAANGKVFTQKMVKN